MALLLPNTELVTLTYLRSAATEASATFGVGTTLPENTATWVDGFAQVLVVGGAPDVDTPVRRPLIQVDCWVPSVNSSKPQWGKANHIAEVIMNAMFDDNKNAKTLALGTYRNARVQAAYLVSEPRRVNNDPAGHARYTFDMTLAWVTAD